MEFYDYTLELFFGHDVAVGQAIHYVSRDTIALLTVTSDTVADIASLTDAQF